MNNQCKTYVNGIDFMSYFTFKELFDSMLQMENYIGEIKITIGDSIVYKRLQIRDENRILDMDNIIELTYKEFEKTFKDKFDIDLSMYLECGLDG